MNFVARCSELFWIAEHASDLLGGDLGHDRDVVEHGGDVVEQSEQAGGHARRGTPGL